MTTETILMSLIFPFQNINRHKKKYLQALTGYTQRKVTQSESFNQTAKDVWEVTKRKSE